jgi:putative spermidine/putrescine transport system permease protein
MVRGRDAGARLARLGLAAVVAIAFVIMVAPILLVVWLSFFSNEILSLPPEGYSLRWYAAMFGQRQFTGGFTLSLEVAVIAASGGLLVSLPASLALVRGSFPGREAVLQMLMSPLIVPAIVVGAGLYVAFIEFEIQTDIAIAGSLWGLCAGHILITIPWCVRLLTANLAGMDPAMEEAAASLGARPAVTLLRVTLPAIWPGLVAAALFGFVVSFGNLEVSLFLVAPGRTTLPIAVLQYLEWKIDPTIAAVSAAQAVVIGLGLLITDRFVSLTKVV